MRKPSSKAAGPRVASVAADLVEHFEAISRDICVHLYNEIARLRPDWIDADPEKAPSRS